MRFAAIAGVEDTELEAKDTKKSEAKAKNWLSEDRPSQGQGQECLRSRTQRVSVLQKTKKEKRSSRKNRKFFVKYLTKKKKVVTLAHF